MSMPASSALPKINQKAASKGVLYWLSFLNPGRYMSRFSARFHIATGLTSFVGSVALLAVFLGLVPERSQLESKSRIILSEAVAALGSVLLREGDASGLRYSLEFVVEQNPDIVAIDLQSRIGGSYSFKSAQTAKRTIMKVRIMAR